MLGDLLDDLAGERWGKMNLLFLVLPLHFGVKVHTLYLSFFLHGQNFWRKKFTPKNANFRVKSVKKATFRVKSVENANFSR